MKIVILLALLLHSTGSLAFFANKKVAVSQDEKHLEEVPGNNASRLLPVILSILNSKKNEVVFSYETTKYRLSPASWMSLFVDKITSEIEISYKSMFSRVTSSYDLNKLVRECLGMSPQKISICTYVISGKNEIILTRKEDVDLQPFFSSREEFLGDYLAFQKQKKLPEKSLAVIEDMIFDLPHPNNKGDLFRTLFGQLDKLESITKHTAALPFFSALRKDLEKLKIKGFLLSAAQLGDGRGILTALKAGADIFQSRRDGKNVLHISSELGDLQLVEWLLKVQPKLINSLDQDGRTPIHLILEALPYEKDEEIDQGKILSQHDLIKMLFRAGGRIRSEATEDTKEENPLAGSKIGNNLGHVAGQQDLVEAYGPQNIFEDLGKEAIWSLAQALKKKRPWALNFKDALDFIALNRRLVAYLQEARGQDLESHLMGLNRFLVRDNELLTPLSRVRQGSDAYAKKMRLRWEGKSYHNVRSFSLFEGPYDKLARERKAFAQFKKKNREKFFSANVCHLGQKLSDEGHLSLSCFDIGDENFAAVRHTRPEVLAPALSEMSLIFNHIIEDPNAQIESIAKIHWWLAQTTPHIRGGGAIAEWMAIALMLYKGIDFRGWAPRVETWAEAMVYSEQEFVEMYRQFLQ